MSDLVAERLSGVLEQLTLEEKAALTAGADMWSTVSVERLAIPALTMTDGPNGARGPMLPEGFGGEVQQQGSTCVPCGSALGATWDPELVEKVGALVGAEARQLGCQVLLAPTVNLHRSPLGGRNFESYSEDPLLTGSLAAAYIRGAQSQGVLATVKHFVGNESETDRMSMSSLIDERSLRELYLVPFEMAVRDADVAAVMTAYNRLNGVYCSNHAWLLSQVLREEWGFRGLVLTDWYAVAGQEALAAGLDLQMPGPGRSFGPALAEAVTSGAVTIEQLDGAVGRLLTAIERAHDVGEPESVTDPAELLREAAAAATVLLTNDGVLPLDLTSVRRLAVIGPNADRAEIMGGGSANLTAAHLRTPLEALRSRLPADVEIRHEPGCDLSRASECFDEADLRTPDGEPGILVEIFPGAATAESPVLVETRPTTDLVFLGSPLENVAEFRVRATATLMPSSNGRHILSLTQAGRARVFLDGVLVLDGTAPVQQGPSFFGTGSAPIETAVDLTAGEPRDLRIEYSNTGGGMIAGARLGWRVAPPVDLLDRAVAAAEAADAVVLVVGTGHEWESEGFDRASMALPAGQDELVRRVTAANPRTVVLVNAGSAVEMAWCDQAAAVAQVWFGGQEMAEAVVDVLLGVREPGGRLPHTVPLRIEDCPSYGNLSAERGECRYGEGLLMGYRGFDTSGTPTRFPFGHGLGYTTFAIASARLSKQTWSPGEPLQLLVDVTNTGTRPGTEVVQVYVAPPRGELFRPHRELKAFRKVRLEAGQTTQLLIELPDRAFAHWDPGHLAPDSVTAQLANDAPWSRPPSGAAARSGWRIESGSYQLHVGFSLADIRQSLPLLIET